MSPRDHLPSTRILIGEIITREKPKGGMAVLNAILDRENAGELIRSLEPEELHSLVLEVGKADSAELICYASEEQFQGYMDLDNWVGAEFRPERLEGLMGLAASAGEEAAGRLFGSMDPETVGLYLLNRAKVHVRTFDPDEEVPDVQDGEVMCTPDDLFRIELPHGSPHFAAVKFFIDQLYNWDRQEAVSLIKTIATEEADVLEEEAVRFRTARVQAMGFPSYDQTRDIFRYVNPVQLKARIESKLARLSPVDTGQETLLPALLDFDDRQPPFLASVLAAVDDAGVRRRVAEAVVFLANAVIVDESGGDLADVSGRERGIRRALSFLSLGLEYVSANDQAMGRVVIAKVWPKTLFRLGHSLCLTLRQRATRLLVSSGGDHGFMLFDPPLDDVIRGVASTMPQYFVGLEEEGSREFRDFYSVRDVGRARTVLEQAEGVARFVEANLRLSPEELGRTVPEDLKPMVTHTTLMSTALVNALLGAETLLEPVAVSRVPEVLDVVLIEDGEGNRTVNPRLQDAIGNFLSAEEDKFAAALFDLSLRKLESVFLRLPRGTVPDRRFLGGALLVR